MPNTPKKRGSYNAKAMKGKRGRPRKTAPVRRAQETRVSTLRKMISSVRWTESYTSLLMGVVVVIVAVLFVVSFLKQTHNMQSTSSISTVAPSVTTAPSELKPSQSQKTYTVQAGDDLWHIAEKFYNSGYNWVDIAQANNLTDPGIIHAGNTLVIPSVTPKIATVTATPTPSVSTEKAITGSTYTVQKGDDLWHIAVRAYADGYQWVKIAQANNLANPDIIYSGNILKIPR